MEFAELIIYLVLEVFTVRYRRVRRQGPCPKELAIQVRQQQIINTDPVVNERKRKTGSQIKKKGQCPEEDTFYRGFFFFRSGLCVHVGVFHIFLASLLADFFTLLLQAFKISKSEYQINHNASMLQSKIILFVYTYSGPEIQDKI